jgi:heptosyltransferase III
VGARAALAIHPGALGDVLLAIPALRALRADGSVALAAQPRIAALLLALDVVDAAVAFDALGLDALFADDTVRQPRLPAVERVVSWFGSREPSFVRRLAALVPGAIVAPSVRPGRPVWQHLLDTVGASPAGWCAPVAAPAEMRALGLAARHRAGGEGPPPWLLVHPGAGSPAKRWPAEAFARVITALAAGARMNVVVHQGPADAGAAAALRRHVGDGVVWLVEPTLPELAGVLAEAAAFVGNDSGVGHLAAALGVPSVVLFDARHLDWRPWWAGAEARTVTLTQVVAGEVAAVVADVRRRLG